MGFNDFWINNNGKKEHLNNAKHGVRKEQMDKKFHNLFDTYDANGDGTLENEELDGVFKGLTKFAGADKTLDAAENKQVANLFANQAGIEDADFMGFVRSVSKATEDIVDSKTTPTADGGREVTTTYKDGSVETISYYPDGEYKFKKLDQKATTTTNFYTIGNDLNKKYTAAEIESRAKKAYQQRVAQIKASAEKNKPIEGKATYIIPNYNQFKQEYMQRNKIYQGSDTRNFERHDFELSERGKQDVAVRDFVLSHYIETHKAAQEALESMGILDDVGAAINAGAGELWNSIKNVWNGTEEEYQNFYELSKKFEPNYNKALKTGGYLDIMRNNPEMFFRGFETDFKKDMGHQYNLENSVQFQQTAEQYQNAQILKQRIDILNKAMQEIKEYQAEKYQQNLAMPEDKINPYEHINNANKLLLEYFGGDKDAVNLILNGTLDDADATIKAISGIKEDTEKLNKAVLDGKTFDQIQEDYKSQYKAMYGTDFVPDELTEKVMDAKATGGMVKLAAITIVSILVTRSPIMAEISAAAGGAEVSGAAANMIRTLVAKYGQTAVQQGIKLAMTSGTLASDAILNAFNRITSESKDFTGYGSEVAGAAKYIFFGAYVGAPMAQAVSKSLGKIGATSRLFEGGVKTGEGAIQTTSITGDKLLQNFMKGGNKVLTTGGAFLTDVAAFTGLEVATDGANLQDALSEQGQMLSKLKVMNHVLEYMLGAKTHTAMSKANLEAAIEKSGVKNWNIKEIKTPQKTQYIVDIDGLPVGKFEDANQLATAMLERVTANYNESSRPQTKTTKPEGEVKATPETEVETETARRDALKAELRDGKKVTTSEEINIPAGKFEAPNAKFAETDEAFRSIVTKRSADIKELDKISDIDEFCRKSFELMKEEMGLEDSDIKLEITDKDNYYDHETNTVYISRNWAGKEKGHVKGKGDKAEIFGGMAHELNHYLQWKEIVLNFDSENPNWNNIISYLQQFEGAQKNIEYLIEKYPDNTELKEFFEKAKSYQDNWLNYTDAFDENGKLKTGAEYDKYRNQTVEAESFRRGDIVAEEYRKTVAEVKHEGAEINPLLTRLETANDRESFVAIRDEIKKMPNGEEKTQLMQAYLKKYNEWSVDPTRPDIRMEHKPLDPKTSTLTDLMKDILGDINDAEPISEQTATELHRLLDNLDTVMKPEKVDEFLSLIPNEHCAKVLSRYFDKFKDNDWQTANYYQLIYDMKSAENVKELVRVIESPEINEDIKTPKNLSYTTFSGKPNQFEIAASYDVFKKITDAGLGARGNSAVINFQEIDYIMNKITDPQEREFVAKLYTSKLFSRVDFYKLLQMDRETDLTNLSKIENMMDEYSSLEKMEMQDINHLLKAPDEILEIISQRNLLKNIPNRKYKFTGNEAIKLAEVDDATWQIILDRKLLEDVRADILRPALGTGEIKTYAKLSDTEWTKLKSRKLFEYPENINGDLKELYTRSDFISKIARLSDSDYAKIEQLVKHPNKNVKLLRTVIKKTESGTYLDEPMLNYSIKLAEILESSGTDVQRMLTGLNNQDGTFNAECADKLYDFILELKNDNFSMEYLKHALHENVRTKLRAGVVTLSWNDLIKRPPFSVGEIDAKSRIYKSMKEFDRYELSEFDRAEILKHVNAKSEKFIDQLLHDESLGYSPKSKILNIFGISEDSMEFLAEQDINVAHESALYQRQKALEAPDRYVNGEYDSVEDMQAAVNKFFDKQDGKIMLMASIYDKEALNNLLRMRFDDAEEYFHIIHYFEKPELELLQKMSASCNVDGKPFMPTQKIELMDLIQAYHENELPFDKMYSMLEEGNIDIGQLNIDLFNKIMKNSGLTDEEIASIPKEKLTAWDTKFAHLLSKEINSGRDVAFSDVLRAGNLSPDFIQYIHNTENVYGQTNANTKAMYEQMGMDYEHWLKPSKENEIHFLSKDKNAEQLSQIGNQLLEDIETLRATPVKGFLDKQFPKCIKDGKFVIPTEVLTSKAKLNEFTTNLIKQLDSVWKRAQGNLENPQRAANARNTLTILDHFNQRLDDISKVQDGGKATKTLDVTIKMWDRNPQKDIFQGNYSTCCIGMGGGNGSAMPHFVLDTAYNMIELVDNQTGKTIGNALCYFIKGEDGKPAFIIDNIEINNAVRPSEEVGLQLRNSMVEFASRVSKEVTGSDDISIYMSGSFNDVPCKDLKIHEQKVSFLGDIDCEDIYMDLYGGWVNKEDVTAKLPLLKLK